MKKEIKVGIIGLGFIGKIHAQAYMALPQLYGKNALKAKLAAVLRTHKGDEPELIASLGNPLELMNMNEFMKQGLDVVDICSPNNLHFEQIKAVITHKAHIYCEKPIALNLEQAHEITRLADEAGILTHTAFVFRYYPGVRQMKAILDSGALGEIYNFRTHYFHNSYMDPLRPISRRLQWDSSGGGALADLGIHIIDMLRFLLGDVGWVRCETDTFIKQRPARAGSNKMVPVDVDDWALCTIGLQSGVRGVLEVTRLSGGVGDSMRFEVFGSRGSLVFDMNQPEYAFYYDQNRQQTLIGLQDFPTPQGERPFSQIQPARKMSMGFFRDAHAASIYDFLLNISEGKKSNIDFHTATKAQEVLEAAYISSKHHGEKIQLPLP